MLEASVWQGLSCGGFPEVVDAESPFPLSVSVSLFLLRRSVSLEESSSFSVGEASLAAFVLGSWDRWGQQSHRSECTLFLHFSVFCLYLMSDVGYADISGNYAPVFVGWEAKTMSWAAPGLSGRQRTQGQTGCFQRSLGSPKPKLFLQFCGLSELGFC